LVFYQVWDGYANLTELWIWEKPFGSKMKKPDRDNLISSPANFLLVYIGYLILRKNQYFQP